MLNCVESTQVQVSSWLRLLANILTCVFECLVSELQNVGLVRKLQINGRIIQSISKSKVCIWTPEIFLTNKFYWVASCCSPVRSLFFFDHKIFNTSSLWWFSKDQSESWHCTGVRCTWSEWGITLYFIVTGGSWMCWGFQNRQRRSL